MSLGPRIGRNLHVLRCAGQVHRGLIGDLMAWWLLFGRSILVLLRHRHLMWRLLLGVARHRLVLLTVPCKIHWLLRVLLRLLLVSLLLVVYLMSIGLLTMLRDLRLNDWLLRGIEVIDLGLGLGLAVLRWPWSRHSASKCPVPRRLQRVDGDREESQAYI